MTKRTILGDPVEVIDIGDSVCCDDCNKEFKGSLAIGGLLFQSKAICPECEPKWRKEIAKYGEEHLIRGYCPQFMTFHAWVLQLRGGDNSIKVYSL
jgi:hypothetical protein